MTFSFNIGFAPYWEVSFFRLPFGIDFCDNSLLSFSF